MKPTEQWLEVAADKEQVALVKQALKSLTMIAKNRFGWPHPDIPERIVIKSSFSRANFLLHRNTLEDKFPLVRINHPVIKGVGIEMTLPTAETDPVQTRYYLPPQLQKKPLEELDLVNGYLENGFNRLWNLLNTPEAEIVVQKYIYQERGPRRWVNKDYSGSLGQMRRLIHQGFLPF